MLFARVSAGNIAGTLLLHGPGAKTVFAPMLGPASGIIGCVGVAPPRQGQGIGTALVVRASEILRDAGTRNCHIGWTVRETFSAARATSRGHDTPSSPAPPDRLRLPQQLAGGA